MHQSTMAAIVATLFTLVACNVAGEDEPTKPGDHYSSGGDVDPGDGGGDDTNEDDGSDDGSGAGDGDDEPGEPSSPEGTMLATGCAPYGSGVYTPFPNYGPVSTGTVATYPWRGPQTYPDTIEDFRQYGPALPQQVECGASKGVRDHLDVTAGCLSAVLVDGDKRGRIQLTADGYYRSFALPYDADHDRRVAWGDQGVEYRFNYSAWTGTVGNPGFKAFARYMTEYDLYVASWRRDGVVQIQKKHCGVYTTLKRDPTYGAPSFGVWHTIRFEAVGSELRLYLDGKLAMTATDSSIKHGTTGIRIDSANGAHIDDWRSYAP